ncbi:helix-turn-helix transcriptional regulator [Pseudoflavonifractor sp. DSM 107456]|uniref:Helix-turn-helix transcriptional regulator n=1 Tax=Pseudoflavonifractor gallinarum TaxID=2779352 RepID=A0ABR9R9A7_9FIRM|nr:helix-turn-helix transcriptional regulator [Pseudoflavonifractor gallinarum]MBS6215401.1 helix-turn-helix transcriptional regulator [Clostridiales bacterium]MBS6533799.1 helix-turn-helix transcriptional regulator [Oscillospiraceae bacterium]
MNEGFPTRLRRLREARRMSRRTLSELCGLSKDMISIYERGEADPSTSTVCLLADYFETTTDYLLGRTEKF